MTAIQNMNRRRLTQKQYTKMIFPDKGKKKKTARKQKGGLRRKKGWAKSKDKQLIKNAHFLGLLGDNPNRIQRKALVGCMNKQQMGAVKHLVNTFLKKRYHVPPKILKRLRTNKRFFYKLLNPEVDFENQKKIVQQKGGFLSMLLPLAGSIIAPALKGIFR